MSETCLEKERFESKVTPRLRMSGEGIRIWPEKVMDGDVSFESCWGVPTVR